MTHKWQYILFFLFLILAATGMAQEIEVTLEEVIDLVNFSREIIEDGELNVIFFESPEHSELLTKQEATQRAKVELERWKQEYQQEKEHRKIDKATDKLNQQNAIEQFEGYIKYLTEGKATYEEQNIAFRVKPDADLIDPRNCTLYRLYSVDRSDRYNDDSPRNNRYLTERMYTLIDYHDLLVVNREYRLNLKSNHKISHGSLEPTGDSRIYIPFNLMGRLYFPIQIENVVDHGWEQAETGRYFTIEYKPNLSFDIQKNKWSIQGATVKVWLDPKLDYCVIRDEGYLHTAKGKFKVQANTYTEFKRFSGGIWFPRRIEGRTYLFTKPNTIERRLFYIVRGADFNIGMPPDFFDLDVKEVLSTGIKIAPYDR